MESDIDLAVIERLSREKAVVDERAITCVSELTSLLKALGYSANPKYDAPDPTKLAASNLIRQQVGSGIRRKA